MKIDLQKINELVEQGYIDRQKHPEFPLYIYNYSRKCQYDAFWTEETMMCRGLILDEEGNIVARPFKKFFNIEELPERGLSIPNEPFEVREKYDGSLGISYWWNGEMYLATRGSFTSDQAIVGTKLLNQRNKVKHPLSPKWTYLFEIIYPENKIVIDYGGQSKLVLLAIQTVDAGDSAAEVALTDATEFAGFEIAKLIDANDYTRLKELEKPNSEGFVIRFESGFRMKVKFDEYVRLHKIVTGINSRRIWECLMNGDDIDQFLQNVPDEFDKWVRKIQQELTDNYDAIFDEAWKVYTGMKHMQELGLLENTRKAIAQKVMQYHKGVSSIVFALLDDKPYEHIIWKMVKPEITAPFKVDEL